ncbi:hypothetical protein CLOM_g59 [Closterium sp. NIES-68]|nr:hypothetical protein CLOM_g59 [Closterium sp. NIES-68]
MASARTCRLVISLLLCAASPFIRGVNAQWINDGGVSPGLNVNANIIDCGCDPSGQDVCGTNFVTYPSYCDAQCNNARVLTRGPCTRAVICGRACLNRAGMAPDATLGIDNLEMLCGAVCPYPLLSGGAFNCPERSQCMYTRCGIWN